MVVGFNHNFKYQGVVYHIQTEDGGLNSPNIVTLLYHGGTILASRKTSYADITRADHLGKVVEDLMKEQHKGMLHSLRNGDFDDLIARYAGGRKLSGQQGKVETGSSSAGPIAGSMQAKDAGKATAKAADKAQKPADKQPPPPQRQPDVAASLDEIVLSYLMGDDKR